MIESTAHQQSGCAGGPPTRPPAGRRCYGAIAIVLALALFTLAAAPASRFDKVGRTLMCTCGCNEILLECNHLGCPVSEPMRTRLTALIGQDASDDAIYQDFIAEYGHIAIASPIGGGFNRVAWIMPFAFLFAGLIGAGIVGRKWKRKPSATPPQAVDEKAAEGFRAQARKDTEE